MNRSASLIAAFVAASVANANRISFGCINVPDAFFDRVIEPARAKSYALVCALPAVKTAQQVFQS